MADDLDRLLDEVERRLCHRRGGGGPEQPAAAKEGRSAKVLMSADSSEEDLDDIIDEICNDSSFTKTPPKLKSNSASLTPERNSVVVVQARGKRCCPVYLGGSLSPSGIGTNISKRACDQLRCTACDFRVSLFNDYVWDQSCDYLFFRNNMPELSKLRAKMIKKKGARAYACQCSWRSIDELTDLQTEQQLRACRGPAVCLGSLAVLPQCSRLLLPVPMQPCWRVRGDLSLERYYLT
uniref:cilia- and flagella-associated protein 418 n=1 Tax=Agelaius phoeniceus TaxID=39638 RepID=UPI0023EAFE3A|nr:cilia- and flagella-associated protein 418 [Agelaius phoeniceus]